ncbi:MAG: hypothetical protein ACKN9T_15020 [Candidatus Methylumidiphilus sp.]
MSLEAFIEEKLNQYAQKIIDGKAASDELALGELNFYAALRRVASGKATTADLGLFDAINDTLQQLGVLAEGETLTKKIKP